MMGSRGWITLSGQFVWDAAKPMFICGNNMVMKMISVGLSCMKTNLLSISLTMRYSDLVYTMPAC